MEQEYSRWLSHVAESDLLSQLQTMSEQERREAFCCDLSFGTGGLRGIVGAGTNRMNIYTVRRATQGLANYLKAQKLPMSAAIAHDSRLYGRTFAETAACVLAANGIKVYLYPRLEPTPALSWAVRRYACGAGICITASHNPAQYNGYKVYGSDGCQITLDAANAIEAEIAVVDCFMDVQTCGYQEACADGRIESIPDSVLDAYINAVYAQRVTDIDCSGLRLVYTPLCGSGLECVQKLLDRLGVADVTVVPSQAKPDGKFPTCPYPNPEIRESMEEGLRLCREKQPELLIGTDPDCDRCGVAARDQTREYQLISGNEMGVLLLDFICKARLAANTMPHDPVAVTTVVSTGMADRLAAHYGVTLRRTLTGFKYIGEQIALLEQGGHPERYIFGFEESYGYLSGTHARDKDAVNAVLLICEAAAWYAKKGMTLGDAIDALYTEFGCYCNMQKSFAFTGETGMEKMAGLMQGLRKQPLREIAGLPVEGYTDYEAEGTGLPKANVLEYRLPGGDKVIIRPSGTEPKIKAYLSAVKPTVEESNAQLSLLAEAAAKLLA